MPKKDRPFFKGNIIKLAKKALEEVDDYLQ